MGASSRRTFLQGLLLSLCLTAGLLGVRARPSDRAEPAGPTPADRRINELLEPIRKKHKLPSLAGAIVTGKGLVAVGAVGVRKAGGSVPVTVDDRFHIGSNTKAMTAVLIARLVEAGRLSWDTPLEKAFPELAGSMAPGMRKATLVHLLTHRAGLPENHDWWKVPRPGSPRSQREAVVKKALAAAPKAGPGEKYLYSNLSYVIAGAITEKVAGASWEDLLRKEVFAPLGMKSAGFGPPGTPGKVDQPWPHDEDGQPVAPESPGADNPPVLGPAGTVHCSLPDWAKFIADQLKGARGGRGLLRPKTYRRLHTSPFRGEFYTPGGWTGGESPRGVILGHGGSNTLNYALVLLVPSRDFAVLVVTNQGGEAAKKGCYQAVAVLRKHFGKKR